MGNEEPNPLIIALSRHFIEGYRKYFKHLLRFLDDYQKFFPTKFISRFKNYFYINFMLKQSMRDITT